MCAERLVVLGGPGDGLSLAEGIRFAERAGQDISLVGFLNDSMSRGELLHGVPILGRVADWQEVDADIQFIPAIQKVGDMPERARRVEALCIPPQRWGTFVHPAAVVSSDVEIGGGSFVLSCATVQPSARIGRFAGIRAGAMLGHHCVIGDHTYVGPNATMCGRSVLQEGAYLGPGAVLMDGRVMAPYSLAGIAAAVTKDVSEYMIVFGNPARRVGWVKRLAAIDEKS
jgi:sugar O-acyltransferase (sialic acid O-acetyltransferase NeuD family)